VGRLARRLAVPAQPARGGAGGPGRLLARLDAIGQSYFADIHGPDDAEAVAERRVTSDVPAGLRFFSIYSDTAYRAGDHLELLTGFLGFEFDDLAFSFTESDCGNPALMAHLRGLKCEHVYGRSYDEGLAEYVEFALGLMRKKDFPADLVETMRARYDSPEAASRMRDTAARYALETFGLTEEQLVCMAYSRRREGLGLGEFLGREHPALAGAPRTSGPCWPTTRSTTRRWPPSCCGSAGSNCPGCGCSTAVRAPSDGGAGPTPEPRSSAPCWPVTRTRRSSAPGSPGRSAHPRTDLGR